MFNIDKLRIRKIVGTLTVVSCTIFPVTSFAEDAVTPIQLRVMQTRKFLKPSKEVAKTIKVNGEDAGATCNVTAPMYIKGEQVDQTGQGMCFYKAKDNTNALNYIPYVNIFKSFSDSSDRDAAIAQVKYELTSDEGGKETVVRMRIYTKMGGEQSTNNELYQQEFKKLADSLFINAIELNPAVMQ